ncbi:CPBP family intramembrane metalloprotease [soil metagenome]
MTKLDTDDAIFAIAPTWGGRALALGKFVLFVLVMAFIIFGVQVGLLLLMHLKPQDIQKHATEPNFMLMNEVCLAAGGVFATLILAAVFREPIGKFGFGLRQGAGKRLREFGWGVVAGFVLLTGLLAGIAALGGYDFGKITDTPEQALRFGALYALLFGLVALAEETMVRGYALVQLSRAMTFWPAAILLSVLFGAMHISNAGETPVGVFSAGAVGLVLAYSFYRSGSLMWALGFHAAWDYAQSFIWGVADSGVVTPGTLFTPAFHGPAWLTGGSVGPEASWLLLPVLAISAAVVHFTLRRPSRGF